MRLAFRPKLQTVQQQEPTEDKHVDHILYLLSSRQPIPLPQSLNIALFYTQPSGKFDTTFPVPNNIAVFSLVCIPQVPA